MNTSLVLLLLTSTLCGAIIQDAFFQRDLTYSDQISATAINWTFFDVRSKVTCIGSCSRTPGCVSVFFNGARATCQGADISPAEMNVWTADSGSELYFQGTSCEPMIMKDEADVCAVDISEQCTNANCTVFENCTAYDVTYKAFPQWGLDMGHILGLDQFGLTVAECEDVCTGSVTPLCASFNYFPDSGRCLPGTLTPITGASYFMDYGDLFGVDYYLRNCA